MIKKNRIMALIGFMCLQAASVNAMLSEQEPLKNAIESNKVEEVQKLIAAGVEVNAKDNIVPLQTAITVKKPEIVRMLIEAGADVNAKTNLRSGLLLTEKITGDIGVGRFTEGNIVNWAVPRAFITSVSPQEITLGLPAVLEKKAALAKQVLPPQVQNVYNDDWKQDVIASFNRVSQAPRIQPRPAVVMPAQPVKPVEVTIHTQDGKEFKVDIKLAKLAKNLRDLIGETAKDIEENGIPLPSVTAPIWSKIQELLPKVPAILNVDKNINPEERTLVGSFDSAMLKGAKQKNADILAALRELDGAKLIELIVAANYLDIRSLLELAKQVAGEKIADKKLTSAQIAVLPKDMLNALFINPYIGDNKLPNVDIIKTFIDAGVNVNVKDQFGKPPLYYGILSDSPEGVRALIEAGADVNAQVTHRKGVMTLVSLVNSYILLGTFSQKATGHLTVDTAEQANKQWDTPRAFITSVSPEEIALGLPAVLKKKVELVEKVLPPQVRNVYNDDWRHDVEASFNRVSQAMKQPAK